MSQKKSKATRRSISVLKQIVSGIAEFAANEKIKALNLNRDRPHRTPEDSLVEEVQRTFFQTSSVPANAVSACSATESLNTSLWDCSADLEVRAPWTLHGYSR